MTTQFRSPRSTRNIIRQREDRQRELIAALLESGDPVRHDLADRLHRCQQARDARRGWTNFSGALSARYPYQCRSFACEAGCRSSIARQWRNAALRRFAEAENRSCSKASIVLAPTVQVEAICGVVRKARKDFSNMRAGAYPQPVGWRWRSVGAFGTIEIDVAGFDDDAMLAPDHHVLHSIASGVRFGNAGSWLVRAHIAVHHPHLDRAELARAVMHQWPGAGRVAVRPFHEQQSAADNAADFFGRSLNRFEMDGLHDERLGWSPCRRADYHSWLFSQKRGLQPLGISSRPRREDDVQCADDVVGEDGADNSNTSGGWHHDEIEPMPFVF